MRMDPAEIFFCDPDLEWSRGLRARLRGRGFRVTAATSARILLDRLGQRPIDLVVLGPFDPELEPRFLVGLLRGKRPDLPVALVVPPGAVDLAPLREDLGLLFAGVRPVPDEELLNAFAPALDQEGAPAPAPKPKTVMCVDDDPLTLGSIARLMRRQGYRVVAYSDPELAIEAFPAVKPDLAILDILMNGMNGLQMTEEIREIYGPRMPVVLLSALDSDREIQQGIRSGASCYLTKPYEPAVVLDTVDRLMGRTIAQPPRKAAK